MNSIIGFSQAKCTCSPSLCPLRHLWYCAKTLDVGKDLGILLHFFKNPKLNLFKEYNYR